MFELKTGCVGTKTNSETDKVFTRYENSRFVSVRTKRRVHKNSCTWKCYSIINNIYIIEILKIFLYIYVVSIDEQPWYLDKLVTQNTLRTFEGIRDFCWKIISNLKRLSVDVSNCLLQILLPNLLQVCGQVFFFLSF